MTKFFRDNQTRVLLPQPTGIDILPKCETFSKAQVLEILERPGCEGFRVYYGMDEQLRVHAILVGVDAEDADLIPGSGEAGNYIIEEGRRCPDQCPPPSPLNEP